MKQSPEQPLTSSSFWGSFLPIALGTESNEILLQTKVKLLSQTFLGVLITFYILNKKMLPRTLSSIASRIFFWPTVPISLLAKYWRWVTVIDDTVVLGGAPFGFLNIPMKLHNEYGVRGVINMCEEYKGPQNQYKNLGIRELCLPTTDHFEPSLEHMKVAVDFINEHKFRKKGKVYVHCRAGHGRSAAIVYVWLLSQSDDPSEVDMEELNVKLSKLRHVRKKLFRQKNVLKFRSYLISET